MSGLPQTGEEEHSMYLDVFPVKNPLSQYLLGHSGEPATRYALAPPPSAWLRPLRLLLVVSETTYTSKKDVFFL